MSKVTLKSLANLQNESTAVSAINANSTAITTAVENTLSRNGTAPNAMGSNLDMNSFQILNLPSPATVDSPLRLRDAPSGIGVPISSVPPVGTSGSTVPLLNGNNTWSGLNKFNPAPATIYDVRNYGAVGDGITDDTAALQAGLNFVGANGGILSLSNGTYFFSSGLTFAQTAAKNSGIIGPGTLKPLTSMTGAALTLTAGGISGRPYSASIKNITFNFTNNTGLTYGIRLLGVGNTDISYNTFVNDQAGTWGANFSMIWLGPSIPADDNSNCFWTTIHRNVMQPVSGPSFTNVPYGILMIGQTNATQITQNNFTGIVTGVSGQPNAVNGSASNAIIIQGNWFEGLTTCIENIAAPAGGFGYGWEIIDNRAEAVTTFVSLTASSGTPNPSGVPPLISRNTLVSGVYLNNPLPTKYTSFETANYGAGSNQSGLGNVAYGTVLPTNVTGGQNTAVGTGNMSFISSGFFNTAIGYGNMPGITTGADNTSLGYAVLGSLSTGNDNTCIGLVAGANITTGGNNTCIGSRAGDGITTGNSNTIIGANIAPVSAGLSNNIILADGAGVIRAQSDSAGTWTLGPGAIVAKTKAGAFVAADFPAGTWFVGRDTSGTTTKLYYNNAGALMAVALA